MIALLKWTSIAYAGVIALTAAVVMMLLNGVLTTVAALLAYAVAVFLIVPVSVAVVVAPKTMPLWPTAALFAVALYLWIFVLLALGRMLIRHPWDETISTINGALRRPPVAMY